MIDQSNDHVDSEFNQYDDSIQNLSGNDIFESPWNLWKDLKTTDYFFRKNLSKSLYYTLQIRLFRNYIQNEFAKNRSRKGAAVKRAYSYSKHDAKKIIDTLDVLDLHQLWNALDTKSKFDSKSLNDRLESILSKNINSILKNDSNAYDKYTESNRFNHEIDTNIDSDAPTESSLDDSKHSLNESEEEFNHQESNEKDKNIKYTGIDDKFFKLDEMEAFADENLESDYGIDYFDSLGEESDDSVAAADMKYSDFFRDPDDSDQEMEEDLKPLSCKRDLSDLDEYDKQMELMLQQLEDQAEEEDDDEDMYRDELDLMDDSNLDDDEALDGDLEDFEHSVSATNGTLTHTNNEQDSKIAQIENELVAPKHWSLMGESSAKNRPRNSLLDLELELPQPGSTLYNGSANNENDDANGTQTDQQVNGEQLPLELIIIQRIKSGIFDNVERKVFIEDKLESLQRLNKNKNEEMSPEDIDFKKSEMGLGEVYAQKYKEQFMAIDKLDPHKKDLNEQFARLMYKLDSLSNSTFVPKRISESEKVTTVPIISVETPVNVVVSGSNNLGTGDKDSTNRLSINPQEIDPNSIYSGTYQLPPTSSKISRTAKKRKFNNKMKGLIKSGKLSADQVAKIKQNMISRNKMRREDAKSKKQTGLTSREQIKHDMKSNRRIDTNKLLSSIAK